MSSAATSAARALPALLTLDAAGADSNTTAFREVSVLKPRRFNFCLFTFSNLELTQQLNEAAAKKGSA